MNRVEVTYNLKPFIKNIPSSREYNMYATQ